MPFEVGRELSLHCPAAAAYSAVPSGNLRRYPGRREEPDVMVYKAVAIGRLSADGRRRTQASGVLRKTPTALRARSSEADDLGRLTRFAPPLELRRELRDDLPFSGGGRSANGFG